MRTHGIATLVVAASACGGAAPTPEGPLASAPAAVRTERSLVVLPASDIDWQQLNPARGDASPLAADLWGDRSGGEATGFLVRFADGFSSPPHIHNVSYRAVVIAGALHNDSPEAGPVWMPPGSFWTQPKGGAHITSAHGPSTAYVEIDEGPYLVLPTNRAFPTEEEPVRLEASDIDWGDAANTAWLEGSDRDATGELEVAALWARSADAGASGFLVRLGAGGGVVLGESARTLRTVVVGGQLTHRTGDASTTLAPGSHLGTTPGATARLLCDPEAPCLLYVRREGATP